MNFTDRECMRNISNVLYHKSNKIESTSNEKALSTTCN